MYDQRPIFTCILKEIILSEIRELFMTIGTLVFPFAQINVGKIIAGNSFIVPESI